MRTEDSGQYDSLASYGNVPIPVERHVDEHRPPHSVAYAADHKSDGHARGDIPIAGGTYTVTLYGWGGHKIRAISGGTVLAIKNDYADVGNYSASLTIPANDSIWQPRGVTFQYEDNGTWIDIDKRVQRAKTIDLLRAGWPECTSYCESRGGLPTIEQMKTFYWSDDQQERWFWTCEVASNDSGAAAYRPRYHGVRWVYHANGMNKNACRCMND